MAKILPMTRISTQQAKDMGLLQTEKTTKYRSRKTILDGISFDSQKEADKYAELLLLMKAGEIVKLELQPEFILQDYFSHQGKYYKPIKYRADFRVTYKDGREVVIDVKPSDSFQAKEYRIKKKLLLCKWPDLVFEECY
jgi:hypothetical protein